MLATLLALALVSAPNLQHATPTEENNGQSHLVELRNSLQRTMASVQMISGTYVETIRPSDYLVNLYATAPTRKGASKIRQNGATKLTLKQVEGRMSGRHTISFDETRSGRLRLEVARTDGDGVKSRHIYSYDGKTSWSLKFSWDHGHELLPVVRVKPSLMKEYAAEATYRRYLPFTTLSANQLDGTASLQIHRLLQNPDGCTHVSDELIDGVEYCVISCNAPPINGREAKETVRISRRRNGLIKQFKREVSLNAQSKLTELENWTTEEVRSATLIDGANKPTTFWYPATVHVKSFDSKQNPYYTTDIHVTMFELNKARTTAYFTPQIEDGATVFDGKGGPGFTYGHGPSQRVRSLLEKDVIASREQIAKISLKETDGNMTPPTGIGSILTKWASAAGIAGLLVAVCIVTVRKMTRVA